MWKSNGENFTMNEKRYTEKDAQFSKKDIGILSFMILFVLFLGVNYFEPMQVAIGALGLVLIGAPIWIIGSRKRSERPDFIFELKSESVTVPLTPQDHLDIAYSEIEDVYVDKAINKHSFFSNPYVDNQEYFVRLVIKEAYVKKIARVNSQIERVGHLRNGKIDEKSLPIFVVGFNKEQLEEIATDIRENIKSFN